MSAADRQQKSDLIAHRQMIEATAGAYEVGYQKAASCTDQPRTAALGAVLSEMAYKDHVRQSAFRDGWYAFSCDLSESGN